MIALRTVSIVLVIALSASLGYVFMGTTGESKAHGGERHP
jgi:hypothetical protein